MDIQTYIASGILENYALGLTTDQERREVECMSAIYPELKTELLAIQSSLESYAEALATPAPKHLRASILEQIKHIEQDAPENTAAVTPKQNNTIDPYKQGRIIRMNGYLKMAVAASIVFCIGTAVLYMNIRSSQDILQNKYASLKQDSDVSQDQVALLNDSLAISTQRQQLMLAQETQVVVLAGTAVSPDSKARVFWNQKQEQYLFVSDQLPIPEVGKQYQLWAIADGKPMDLGVLDKSTSFDLPKKIKLNQIQAFAITLEKEGGSPTPTLEQLYVIGEAKS